MSMHDSTPLPRRPQVLNVEALTQTDALSRARFADYLLEVVEAVEADRGAVVGLTGPWGSGKSWLLNCARVKLEALQAGGGIRQVPLWVDFSPWRLSGADALLEALLAQIGEQIKLKDAAGLQRGAALGEAIIDFAQAVGMLRHAAPALALVNPALGLAVGAVATGAHAAAKAGSEAKPWLKLIRGLGRPRPEQGEHANLRTATQALEDSRVRVSAALQDLGQRVVVVIDDVDRMAPREIADIVQMVKAVADFPGVVYVLAYDVAVVSEALRSALQVPDGRAYLEKIVQVSLRMPEATALKLADALKHGIQRALDYAQWQPQDLEDQEIDIALPLAAAMLDTPRDLQRLELHLKIAAKLLKAQVCLGDLLLIETLQLKAPEVVEWLDTHRALVMQAHHLWMDEHYRARGDVTPEAPRLPRNGDPGAETPQLIAAANARGETMGRRVIEATRFLFDALNPRARVARSNVAPYRIQALRNWIRWRGLIEQGEWSENQRIHHLLRAPQEVRLSPYWSSVERFGEFIVLALPFIEGQSDFDAAGLVKLLAAAANEFGGLRALEHAALGLKTATDIGRLMRLCAPPERSKAITALIEAGLVLQAGQALVPALEDDTVRVEHPEIRDLVAAWRHSAVASLSDLSAWHRDGANPVSVAQLLVRFDEPPAEVRAALESLFRSGLDEALFACFELLDAETLTRLWVNGEAWLPEPDFMCSLLSQTPQFAHAHAQLVEVWRARSR